MRAAPEAVTAVGLLTCVRVLVLHRVGANSESLNTLGTGIG